MEIDLPEVIVIYAGEYHTRNACEFLESISDMVLVDKYNYDLSYYEKFYGGKLSKDNFVEISPFEEPLGNNLSRPEGPHKNDVTFVNSKTDNHCAFCDKNLGLQGVVGCSGCHNSLYCDRDCHRKDWPKHKEICLNIKKYFPQ